MAKLLNPEATMRRVLADCEFPVEDMTFDGPMIDVPRPRLPLRAKLAIGAFASTGVVSLGLALLSLPFIMMSESMLWPIMGVGGAAVVLALACYALYFVRAMKPLVEMDYLFSPYLSAMFEDMENEMKWLESQDDPRSKSMILNSQKPIALELLSLLRLQADHRGEELDRSAASVMLQRQLQDLRSYREGVEAEASGADRSPS